MHGQISLEHISLDDGTNVQHAAIYQSYYEPVPLFDQPNTNLKLKFELPPYVHVRLCGFGEAHIVAPDTEPHYNGSLSRMNQNSSVAPETIVSRDRGFPADIWGLGCTLVSLFTAKSRLFGDVSTDMFSLMKKFCGEDFGLVPFYYPPPDGDPEEAARQRVYEDTETLEVSLSRFLYLMTPRLCCLSSALRSKANPDKLNALGTRPPRTRRVSGPLPRPAEENV